MIKREEKGKHEKGGKERGRKEKGSWKSQKRRRRPVKGQTRRNGMKRMRKEEVVRKKKIKREEIRILGGEKRWRRGTGDERKDEGVVKEKQREGEMLIFIYLTVFSL